MRSLRLYLRLVAVVVIAALLAIALTLAAPPFRVI